MQACALCGLPAPRPRRLPARHLMRPRALADSMVASDRAMSPSSMWFAYEPTALSTCSSRRFLDHAGMMEPGVPCRAACSTRPRPRAKLRLTSPSTSRPGRPGRPGPNRGRSCLHLSLACTSSFQGLPLVMGRDHGLAADRHSRQLHLTSVRHPQPLGAAGWLRGRCAMPDASAPRSSRASGSAGVLALPDGMWSEGRTHCNGWRARVSPSRDKPSAASVLDGSCSL